MVERHRVEGDIFRHLKEEHGPTALTHRPYKGMATGFDFPGPTDYAQGMRTALEIARAAENVARDWARDARGAGSSWFDIANALGRMLPTLDEGEDPAIEAFTWVAPKPSMRFDRVVTTWRCESRDKRVSDTGPYESHPADNETGHAENCARHATDVAAWKRRTGWDDED